jgi:hypothetical protein
MKEEEKYIDALMKKYEYLVVSYAKKVYGTSCLALDREDIEQELRIVLHNAIITYSLSFQEYLTGKRDKPTPLRIYCMSSFKNFSVKLFSRIAKENVYSSFDVAPYDWGEEDQDPFSASEMLRDTKIKIFEGLSGKELLFYHKFIKGGGNEDKETLKELCDKYSFSLKKGKEIIQRQRLLIKEQINQH